MTDAASPTHLPEALDGIDVAQGVRRMSGNIAVYRQVAETFLEEYSRVADTVRGSLRAGAGGGEDTVRLVHTCKGLLRSLGAVAAAQALETALREGGDAAAALDQYAEHMAVVCKSVQDLVSRVAPEPEPERQVKVDAPRILVVDDERVNITMVSKALGEDALILPASSGLEALELAAAERPDLILLGVMMPTMDGYEVCQRLKENPRTQDIPVIFVTALDDEADEAHGFSFGAVDYITKPISPAIVQARVETHLALRRASEDLEARNQELERAIQAREDMERVMRHDLKGPLSAIIGMPDVLMMNKDLDERTVRILMTIRQAGERMSTMVSRSLDLARMEQGTYELTRRSVDVGAALDSVLAELESLISAREVSIAVHAPNKSPVFGAGEEPLVRGVLSNLIKNAVEAAPLGGDVEVTLHAGDPTLIAIRNDGAVPEDIRDRFFDKYVTGGKRGGTGLGTYSARLMARVMGGDIELEAAKPGTTVVTVSLPAVAES